MQWRVRSSVVSARNSARGDFHAGIAAGRSHRTTIDGEPPARARAARNKMRTASWQFSASVTDSGVCGWRILRSTSSAAWAVLRSRWRCGRVEVVWY